MKKNYHFVPVKDNGTINYYIGMRLNEILAVMDFYETYKIGIKNEHNKKQQSKIENKKVRTN